MYIDKRVLGLYRQALGAVVLLDRYMGYPSICDFYSRDGIYPGTGPDWILHGDDCRWSTTLHWVQALLGWLMLTRRGGRGCSALLWIVYLSERHRQPIYSTGGDALLVVALMWSALMPQRGDVYSVAVLAMRIQVLMMYTSAALRKLGDLGPLSFRWLSGDAVAQVLACPYYTTQLGRLLLKAPLLCKLLTWSAMAVQGMAPLLFLLDTNSAAYRLYLASLVALHIGMAAAMRLAIFTPICLTCLVLFLPSRKRVVPAQEGSLARMCSAALLALSVAATLWESRDILTDPPYTEETPWVTAAATALRLPMQWRMFIGSATCTWHNVSATTREGSIVADLHALHHGGRKAIGLTPLWQHQHILIHDLHGEYIRAESGGRAEWARQTAHYRDEMGFALGHFYCRRFRALHLSNVTIEVYDHEDRDPRLNPSGDSTTLIWTCMQGRQPGEPRCQSGPD